MIPVKYRPEFKDRRINPYCDETRKKIKKGDWVLCAPNLYNFTAVKVERIFKYSDNYSDLWRIMGETKNGMYWNYSYFEVFAWALPHEIDERRLPNLGAVNLLHQLDFESTIEDFRRDLKDYLAARKNLTKERDKLALDGLKMVYLSMNIENQKLTSKEMESIL